MTTKAALEAKRAAEKAQRLIEARREDLRRMQSPGQWPQWPYLPIKRRVGDSNWPELGLLVETGIDTPPVVMPKVYLTNLFCQEKLTDVPTREYPSFEALLDDGWVVD